jgi:succinyl-CoA synthetase alpha subunit
MLILSVRPIAALIGGVHAKPGRVMGHAGAWAAPGEGIASSKSKALEDAGVTMVDHPAKFGGVMKNILSLSGRDVKGIVSDRVVVMVIA